MNERVATEFSKDMFDRMISEKVLLIRTEARMTQEQMASMIGLSKKTLVQVEKERKTLGFTAAALVSILFRKSEIIQAMFGESTLDIVELIALQEVRQETSSESHNWIQRAKEKARYKSMGRRIWWKDERVGNEYILQSHILTGHFRIIDRNEILHHYGMDPEQAEMKFTALDQLKHKQ
jgi:DNA-binding XRE family transcriptional regulator